MTTFATGAVANVALPLQQGGGAERDVLWLQLVLISVPQCVQVWWAFWPLFAMYGGASGADDTPTRNPQILVSKIDRCRTAVGVLAIICDVW